MCDDDCNYMWLSKEAAVGRVGEEKSRKMKIREEKVRGKKVRGRENAAKWRNMMFFQWFVAPEGQKVGSRRARSHPARWEMQSLHAAVVRSTFRSQKCKKLTVSDHFWKLICWKSARRCCGAKHISKSKCTKHTRVGALLEVEMSKKCTALWRKALEEDLERCISRGRCNTRDMFMRDVRRSGRWFPERGCILEHQIFRFAEMILRDRCSLRMTWHHFHFPFWRKSRRIA